MTDNTCTLLPSAGSRLKRGRLRSRGGIAELGKGLTTPGWTRTSDPGIGNLRRDDFAVPEETTKSTVNPCPSTTSESTFDFASTASFTAEGMEKGTGLRNPQIHIGHRNPSRPCSHHMPWGAHRRVLHISSGRAFKNQSHESRPKAIFSARSSSLIFPEENCPMSRTSRCRGTVRMFADRMPRCKPSISKRPLSASFAKTPRLHPSRWSVSC